MVTPDKFVNWEKVRQELKAIRTEKFEHFLRHPGDIRLAVEIKLLDDEMWDCSEHLIHEQKSKE